MLLTLLTMIIFLQPIAIEIEDRVTAAQAAQPTYNPQVTLHGYYLQHTRSDLQAPTIDINTLKINDLKVR